MNWRPLPQSAKYELSDTGRLRGPRGMLCKPQIARRGLPAKARYYLTGNMTITIRLAMAQVWGVNFEPTREWAAEVWAEIAAAKAEQKDGRRAAAKAGSREARAKAQAAEAMPAPEVEEWRTVPEEPLYELSNKGRLRGPFGLKLPYLKQGAGPGSALYALKSITGKTTALMIRKAMGRIWDIELAPDREWIERVRAEVAAEGHATKPEAALRLVDRPEKAPSEEDRGPARFCADCGKRLTAGYWRRCPECWTAVRKGLDMPLEEYGTAGRR